MGFIEIYDMEIGAHGAEKTRPAIGKVRLFDIEMAVLNSSYIS